MSVNYGIVYCQICKKRIPNPVHNQKYCSEKCRKIATKLNRRNNKDRKRIEYLKRKEKKYEESRPKITTISEIVKAAMAEGMQYGEYCLKHHLY